MFKINQFVHVDLNISDTRDKELELYTKYIANRVKNESEFILELEKENGLNTIEKLYIAAQFGRLYRGEIHAIK
jgi:hypothetical protein